MSKLREQKFDAWWENARQSWTAIEGDLAKDVAKSAYAAGQEDLAELRATLDLLHDSDMRAIKMWREAHPSDELVWPDRAKMIFWLLESNGKLVDLFRQGMKFIPRLIDAHCGNSEGTPCDDFKPKYVCQEHKWLNEVRTMLRGEKK